jgi:hypothetical protein
MATRSLEASIEDLVYRHPEPHDRVRQDLRLTGILIDIVDERRRQEEIGDRKREQGIDWRSCADPALDGGDWQRFAILGEEVGEVARAILEAGYSQDGLDPVGDRDLRAEIVQVAAVAVAWVEAIDARELPF